MKLEFAIHLASELDGEQVRQRLKQSSKGYLFETGSPWFRTQRPAEPAKLVGILDCHDNNENALFFVNCLLQLTAGTGEVVRIRDLECDQDFVLAETNSEDNDPSSDLVSIALLQGGSVHVYKGLDELASIRSARQPSKAKPSPERTAKLVSRIGNAAALIKHSIHHDEVRLSYRVALLLKEHPELVPLAIYRGLEDVLDDVKTTEYEKRLDEAAPNLSVIRSLRFTRLSYATLRHACADVKKDAGKILTQGLSRILRENDDFEERFAKYWKRVCEKSKIEAPSSDAELKARHLYFGTQNPFDDAWSVPNDLHRFLDEPFKSFNATDLSSYGIDDDGWLKERPEEDGFDAEELTDDFAIFGNDGTNVDATELLSAIGQQGSHPIEFSADEFFRILGGGASNVANGEDSR